MQIKNIEIISPTPMSTVAASTLTMG